MPSVFLCRAGKSHTRDQPASPAWHLSGFLLLKKMLIFWYCLSLGMSTPFFFIFVSRLPHLRNFYASVLRYGGRRRPDHAIASILVCENLLYLICRSKLCF